MKFRKTHRTVPCVMCHVVNGMTESEAKKKAALELGGQVGEACVNGVVEKVLENLL